MWTLLERLPSAGSVDDEVVLPFDRRQHSRLRVSLVSGREAALLLSRGTMLRHGDRLGGTDTAGKPIAIRVVAAAEEVYVVRGEPLIRAAYHLGNRHVPLELAEDHLRLERDPVLREMLVGLGFSVTDEVLPFEPEPGAYGQGHGHGHGRDAGHLPSHPHDEGHDDSHERPASSPADAVTEK